MANPGSPLKPDLKYSQGYLIPWVQLGIHCLKWEFLYPTTLPWLTQTAHSSLTSGTVKDIWYLGYSPDYTAWNGNFFIQQRYRGYPRQSSQARPQVQSRISDILGTARDTVSWNENFFLSNNASVANQGSLLKPDLKVKSGIYVHWAWNANFLSNNNSVDNPGSPLKPDLRNSQECTMSWVQSGVYSLKWQFFYPTTLPWLT